MGKRDSGPNVVGCWRPRTGDTIRSGRYGTHDGSTGPPKPPTSESRDARGDAELCVQLTRIESSVGRPPFRGDGQLGRRRSQPEAGVYTARRPPLKPTASRPRAHPRQACATVALEGSVRGMHGPSSSPLEPSPLICGGQIGLPRSRHRGPPRGSQKYEPPARPACRNTTGRDERDALASATDSLATVRSSADFGSSPPRRSAFFMD